MVRHVEVWVPSTAQGLSMAAARQSSGWPILPFEKALYGNLDGLLSAYVPPQQAHVAPTRAEIDLATTRNDIKVVVKVSRE